MLPPLQTAARSGDVEELRALLLNGVSPHSTDSIGATALHRAGANLPAETDDPYLQKVINAGGWANYERQHLDRLTAMLTPTPTPNDGRRCSRRRLSPLRRLPDEVLRKIAAFAFHAGFY